VERKGKKFEVVEKQKREMGGEVAERRNARVVI
jgi:hypothetical protein